MALPAKKLTAARVARIAQLGLVLAPALCLALGAWARRWMDDDGFINLRVVRNILNGHGPVYNLGDRVEACTSPLWIGLLALLGAVGAPLEGSAVYGGIVLSLGGLLLAMHGADLFQSSPKGAPRAGIAWPVGAAIYAVLPPAWDYASSGLDTGLGLFWLGGSFAALAHVVGSGAEGRHGRRLYAAAVLFGVGPLIRPEYTLYSGVWLFLLGWPTLVGLADSKARLGMLVRIVASAAALPLVCELLRMGYYGTVTPNTAIAKEAFRANWPQGSCYFRNFFFVYAMGWPGAAAGVFFWFARLRVLRADEDTLGLLVVALPPLAAIGHIVYVVGMGGDYMHARMFLPPVFVILLPIAVVRVVAPPKRVRYALIAAGAALSCWLIVCAVRLRVSAENQCDIGDERRWYAEQASVGAPISIESYRGHPFYEDGQKALHKIETSCPAIASPDTPHEGGCHLLYVDGDEFGQLTPSHPTYPLASTLDPRIGAAAAFGAIGIFGYMMPDAVEVIDRHGLAEPVGSHFELTTRGRPGHEKTLDNAWLVARYTAPLPLEDAGVAAARHALECGALQNVIEAAHAPLTWGRFFHNMAHAFQYTRLRVPHDPFEAEASLCGTRLLQHFSVGGDGGSEFRWHCPEGTKLTGISSGFSPNDNAITRLQPVCGRDGARPERLRGPVFGASSSPPSPFEVTCPSGSAAVGLFGRKDKLVQRLGLVCSAATGGTTRSVARGSSSGTEFELLCPEGTRVMGIVGRAGDLIDQAGIVCGP